MLTWARQRWLVALADPQGPLSRLPARKLPASQLPELLDLADRHGVLPAVVAGVESLQAAQRGFLAAGAGRTGGDVAGSALATAKERLSGRIGVSLMLRGQLAGVLSALSKASLPAVVLRGPDFADRLYPRAALRTFTDIDLLVRRQHVPDAAAIMEQLGYRRADGAMKYESPYGELVFRRSSSEIPSGALEVHWNLVNSPTLRQGVSVTYDDLLGGGPGASSAGRLSASAMLAMAAVHGAASHAFDRLQILCDVRQAVRGAAGEVDDCWLREFAARTGSGRALAAALDLAERVLGEEGCGRLRRRMGLKVSALTRVLLTRGVVLRAHSNRDSFRRQWFRELLKRR